MVTNMPFKLPKHMSHVSASHGYGAFVHYYVAYMLKLHVSLCFNNAAVNVLLGLDTKTPGCCHILA